MSVPTKISIKVQKRSGFDKSHHNALTQQVGTITPILVDEVIPNSKIYLRFAMAGSMAPLATDAYMKCYYDVRAFFVPFRLLYGGFGSWFSDYAQPSIVSSGATNAVSTFKADMPRFVIDHNADFTGIIGYNTLSDYLGLKVDGPTLNSDADDNLVFSCLPFLAYHRVCNDWFRQPNITQEYFARPSSSTPYVRGSSAYIASMLPYVSLSGSLVDVSVSSTGAVTDPNLRLADGVSIFSLRQANYDYDYFTNALPSAQLGNAVTVASASNFSIPALRLANSLQQFSELNMLAGSNEVDVVKARYGANLSRGVAQRCVYLGGARIDMATRSVDVTADAATTSSQNPFKGSVGASAGKVVCQGSNVIIDGFTTQEPGYVFVVGVIIPKVTYCTGVRRYLLHYRTAGSLVEMANPLLQNIGNQPIYDCELTGSLGVSSQELAPFGYTDRYADFMTMEDEVHGEMTIGGTLGSFIAQRGFGVNDGPAINTAFLEVPKTSIDNVSAVSGDVSKYGFYGQFAFDYKVSQPLAQYSLPSLQNPAYEHGQTVKVHRGGFRF